MALVIGREAEKKKGNVYRYFIAPQFLSVLRVPLSACSMLRREQGEGMGEVLQVNSWILNSDWI